jgi:hypothetical protein
MSAYCQVDDAYNTGIIDNVDLDKLAREVNEQKKRNARDIYHNYRNDQSTLSRGISAYNNLSRGGNDKGTEIPHMSKGFFSAQGEYSDLTALYDNSNDGGMLISDICEQKGKDENIKPKRKLRVKRKNRTKTKKDILNDMVKNTYYNKKYADVENHNNRRDTSLELSSISDSDDSFDRNISEISDISYLDDSSDSDTLITNAFQAHSKPISKHKSKKRKDPITLDDIYREIRLSSKFPSSSHSDKNTSSKSKHNHTKKCIDYDLQSIDSLESLESGESLLEHINYCERCRDHVIGLIRKSRKNKRNDLFSAMTTNSIGSDVTIKNKNKNKNQNDDTIENMVNDIQSSSNKSDSQNDIVGENKDASGLELKEILTVCLIGFLVIIILDLTINYRSN